LKGDWGGNGHAQMFGSLTMRGGEREKSSEKLKERKKGENDGISRMGSVKKRTASSAKGESEKPQGSGGKNPKAPVVTFTVGRACIKVAPGPNDRKRNSALWRKGGQPGALQPW